MQRTEGTAGVKLIECVSPARNKWRVRWDVQEQPPNSLSPLLPPVPSAVASGNGEKIPGGLLSDMEPELNYVPRYPRLLKPDKKKCRRRYGRQD